MSIIGEPGSPIGAAWRHLEADRLLLLESEVGWL